MSDYISREAFPSPRGDKLHQGITMKKYTLYVGVSVPSRG